MMQATPLGSRKFLSKRRLVGLVGLSAVVVVGILGMRDRLSPLPRGAYPVLSTAGWTDRGSLTSKHPLYAWLANGDLAYLERNAHGLCVVCYRKMNAEGSIGDVRHGPELPTAIQEGPLWGFFFPSPDERWVAYMQYSDPNQYETVLVSAEGKTKRTLPGEFQGWFSDSRSFLVSPLTIHPYPWEVHHLDTPTTETVPDTTGSGIVSLISAMANRPDVLMGNFALDPHSNIEVPLIDSVGTLRSLRVSKSNIVFQKWQVQIPAYAKFVSVSASPDNKHLLWRISRYGRRPPFWVQWLYGLNPSWQRPTPDEIQYFLSDLHGGGMHSVLNCSLSGTEGFSPLWTPDSKHVSFIQDERLYLAPVE